MLIRRAKCTPPIVQHDPIVGVRASKRGPPRRAVRLSDAKDACVHVLSRLLSPLPLRLAGDHDGKQPEPPD